jgi:hypothetical protein
LEHFWNTPVQNSLYSPMLSQVFHVVVHRIGTITIEILGLNR